MKTPHTTFHVVTVAVAMAFLLCHHAIGQDAPAGTAEAPASEEPAGADADADAAEAELLQRLSYAYGVILGRQLEQNGAKLDLDRFAAGYQTVVDGTESAMTDDELRATLKEHEDFRSSAFLRENAKKEGVTVTDSGLQYEVLEKGDGDKPAATDTVRVHYEGTLTNGEVFDSSYQRGEPISFPLNGVIPGWTEGVQLMPVGSKFRFVIPYDLAYGERGSPPAIPPKATLIFVVELLGIE